MKNLSERLRHAMSHAGVRSQSELARKSGVKQSIISKILTGKNETSKFSGKIAAALGISADWLINGAGDMIGVAKRPLEAIDVSKQIKVWDAHGDTGCVVTWPECLPEHYRAYIMEKNSGVALAPAGAIVIINPNENPGNDDLVLTKLHGNISIYRFVDGGAHGFLSVDDSRVPLFEITDPSCIIGVVEQSFVRSTRK